MQKRRGSMTLAPPLIEPVPVGTPRPLWSVMIPTYNCAAYLRQTLESVLAQYLRPEQMQIEVVDDCSTKDDPEAVVREVGKGHVAFFRKSANEGAVANFNTCIQRSIGQLVHILHGDDYVLPGFYRCLTSTAERHPAVALIASRSFFVDEDGVILGVTGRIPELEGGAQAVESFFYNTPVQTPGVVVRRSFYERRGGFLPALVHTADCEMWARATGFEGGVVIRDVLACYRTFAVNDSGRLARAGENLRDLDRLNDLFAHRYSAFDRQRALLRVCNLALTQAERFSQSGDWEAYRANIRYWKANAPPLKRLRRALVRVIRKAIG